MYLAVGKPLREHRSHICRCVKGVLIYVFSGGQTAEGTSLTQLQVCSCVLIYSVGQIAEGTHTFTSLQIFYGAIDTISLIQQSQQQTVGLDSPIRRHYELAAF